MKKLILFCRWFIVPFLVVFALQNQAQAATLYVNQAATGANNGTSWADAYTDLQTALTSSASGDQIWTAKGVYKPTGTNNRTVSFVLKNNVAVFGGFTGSETLLDQRDKNPKSNGTVLSGDIGVANNVSDNSYHVVVASNVNSSAILDGFTLRDGYASAAQYNPNNLGAGLYIDHANPTLINLLFTKNTATVYGYGGGAYNIGGSPAFINCEFVSNTAFRGGGIETALSSPSFSNITFRNNSAAYGAGMFIGNSTSVLNNVTFNANTASGEGGAIYNSGESNNFSGSTPTLNNVTFTKNTAYSGGAILTFYARPTLNNVILWGNTASDGSNQIKNAYAGSSVLKDSVLQGGGCPVLSTCSNIISTDPLLSLLSDNGGITQTVALQAGSSAINAGNNATCINTDQRGFARDKSAGNPCDIGAYESDASVPAYNLTLAKSGPGTVGSSATPAGISCGTNCLTYPGGTTISLTATPEQGSIFLGWSAGCSDGMVLNGDKLCTAIFGTASSTSLSSAPNPSTVGQAVTFTVAVTGTGGTPTGRVDIKENSNTLCSVTLPASTCDYVFSTAGSKSIDAVYSGDINFSSSTNSLTQVVNKAGQQIDFPQPPPQSFTPNGTFTVSATASSGLDVAFASNSNSVCTVANAVVTMLTSGTCSITASQIGDSNYNAASTVSRDVTINQKLDQTIDFPQPQAQTFVQNGTFTVTASASSNLPVSFSSGSAGVCTVTDSVVTMLTPGLCAITAMQQGDSSFNAASPVTRDVIIKQNQTISYTPPGTQTFYSPGGTFEIVAVASSGLEVTVNSESPTVCTASGKTVTTWKTGTCKLTLDQAGNQQSYNPAPQVSVEIAVVDDIPLSCIDFSPYVGTANPNTGKHPSKATIKKLLTTLKKQTNFKCIMTYGVLNGLDYTFQVSKSLGLKVIAIVWLDSDTNVNTQSITKGIEVAKAYPDTIIRLSCGSEVRTRHGNDLDGEILRCLNDMRAANVQQPLTSIDTWWQWCNQSYPCQADSALADEVDWIGVNVFPWWESKYSGIFTCNKADQAADFHIARMDELMDTYPGVDVVLTEFGWPGGPKGYAETNVHTGEKCGVASQTNQNLVIQTTLAKLKPKGWSSNVFEAYREPWKKKYEGKAGSYWGICNAGKCKKLN